MSERTDAAWGQDPRVLWSMILEDEEAGDAAELGTICEHLFVDVAAARSESARLRAEVHTLTGRLHR